jgi:thioredoxin 2
MKKDSYHLIRCSECGAKNRIPVENTTGIAKCGKCHAELKIDGYEANEDVIYLLRCTECWTRNRISHSRIDSDPRCGKCGAAIDTEALSAPQPLTVSDTDFDRQVLVSPLPVLLFAWAAWCPICRSAMPAIDEFAKDAKGKIRVAKLNVETSPATASKYDIMGVPQILVFDKGRLQETIPGALKKHEIMMKMARYL